MPLPVLTFSLLEDVVGLAGLLTDFSFVEVVVVSVLDLPSLTGASQNTADQTEPRKRKAKLFVPWVLHYICPYAHGIRFPGSISRTLMTGP